MYKGAYSSYVPSNYNGSNCAPTYSSQSQQRGGYTTPTSGANNTTGVLKCYDIDIDSIGAPPPPNPPLPPSHKSGCSLEARLQSNYSRFDDAGGRVARSAGSSHEHSKKMAPPIPPPTYPEDDDYAPNTKCYSFTMNRMSEGTTAKDQYISLSSGKKHTDRSEFKRHCKSNGGASSDSYRIKKDYFSADKDDEVRHKPNNHWLSNYERPDTDYNSDCTYGNWTPKALASDSKKSDAMSSRSKQHAAPPVPEHLTLSTQTTQPVNVDAFCGVEMRFIDDSTLLVDNDDHLSAKQNLNTVPGYRADGCATFERSAEPISRCQIKRNHPKMLLDNSFTSESEKNVDLDKCIENAAASSKSIYSRNDPGDDTVKNRQILGDLAEDTRRRTAELPTFSATSLASQSCAHDVSSVARLKSSDSFKFIPQSIVNDRQDDAVNSIKTSHNSSDTGIESSSSSLASRSPRHDEDEEVKEDGLRQCHPRRQKNKSIDSTSTSSVEDGFVHPKGFDTVGKQRAVPPAPVVQYNPLEFLGQQQSSVNNVIRRKLSAHSKVRNKRISTTAFPSLPVAPCQSTRSASAPRPPTLLDDDTYSEARDSEEESLCDGLTYCESNNGDDDTLSSASRSNLVVRQQPALRVKAIIDKLMYMSGRDQRRALFSLKTIFQNDKDLVHEFVCNGGLECLVQIGRNSDQNHQNHILRAIGQLMLYVDGMNGIIANNETIYWLYQLLDSPYRLVVKTALKLLLVFVEYTESNSLLLLSAISKVEKANNRPEWYSLMRILNEQQASDEETLTFGMTVVNKTLNGVPDQDTFFDVVDVLEAQGIEDALKMMLKLNNTQLTQQCQHYEQELRKEDAALESDSSLNNINDRNDVVRMRVSGSTLGNATSAALDRRSDRARRQKGSNGNGANEPAETFNGGGAMTAVNNKGLIDRFEQQQTQQNGYSDNNNNDNGALKQPPWRRPREDTDNGVAAGENETITSRLNTSLKLNENGNSDMSLPPSRMLNGGALPQRRASPPAKLKLLMGNGNCGNVCGATNDGDGKENVQDGDDSSEEAVADAVSRHVKAPPPSIPTNIFSPTEQKTMDFPDVATPSSSAIQQPTDDKAESPSTARPQRPKQDSDDEGGGGFAALLQKRAKKMENSAFRKGLVDSYNKQSEAELKWKEAAVNLKEKPMIINDLDFSAFVEFEQDPLVLVKCAQVAQERGLLVGGDGVGGRAGGGVPPAPPPIPGGGRVPPPPPAAFGHGSGANGAGGGRESSPGPSSKLGGVSAATGTMKLHWKPAQAEALPIPLLREKGTFWNRVNTPQIDTAKLARLFEQKAKELPIKKPGGESKPQVLQVLSVKRSQAINIGLTKLPPITVIPSAIRKFDASVLNKEGIEKILSTMMPSLEEVERIRERQAEQPDTPLGQAEQFMLSLSEIDCLLERLRLWLFMLDYQNLEKDVAESLMELNNAMKEVEESRTFRVAMGMLLNIGNALNGTDIKAFQLDYLSRASEVKDPVHKYPLTHHLAEYMLDNFPEGTDLYSELGAVSRSSRIDFDAVLDNLKKMEHDCKASFDYVAKISQKDNNSSMKNKVNAFLTEVAERIHRLKHVHRTTIHRWNAFLLYFGYAPADVREQKPINVFKMVIEFALEYRTNRDKILQMRKRMAEKRERNKTRGMMIGMAQAQATTGGIVAATNSVSLAHRRARDARAAESLMTDRERHQEMSKLLTSSNGDSTTLGRRRAGQPNSERSMIVAQTEAMRKGATDSGGTGGMCIDTQDDELLDGVVRTVTTQPTDSRDHSRRRARLFNRKSLRRTRTIRQDQLMELNNMNNY